jgi:2-oxoglutarate ferredoxin oxidoreductase subunit gamma
MNKASKIYKIPATEIAEKELGRKIVANIVMLGFFAELNTLISKNAILKATLQMVPARFQKLNERAFKTGVEYAQKVKQQEVKK